MLVTLLHLNANPNHTALTSGLGLIKGYSHSYRNRRVLAVVLLLGIATLTHATTYYLSSSTGNNSNPGTRGAPWRTMDAFLGRSFSPGDSILFKQGDQFEGQFRFFLQGSLSRPIVVGAYGEPGRIPSFIGDIPNAEWHPVNGRPDYYACFVGRNSIVTRGFESGTPMDGRSVGGLRLSVPAEQRAFLDSFPPSSFGPNGNSDTVWIRVSPGGDPKNVHLFRGANYIEDGSKHVIVQDLELLHFNEGLNITGSAQVLVQRLQIRSNLNIGIYFMERDTLCRAESCTLDSMGNTALYSRLGYHNSFSQNTISNVQNAILGIYAGDNDCCAIGLENNVGTLVINNTGFNIKRSVVDYFFDDSSTVASNHFTATGGGFFPHGRDHVIIDNQVTLNSGSNGINCNNMGSGPFIIQRNIIRNASSYGFRVTSTSNAHFLLSSNVIFSSSAGGCAFIDFPNDSILSSGNIYVGSGAFVQNKVVYETLSKYQAATANERGSFWFPDNHDLESPPLIETPQEGDTVSPTCTVVWHSTPIARFYHLQMDTASSFSMPAIDDSTMTDTLSTVRLTSTRRTWYLRVRGKNLLGWGRFCTTVRFDLSLPSDSGTPTLLNIPKEFRVFQNFPNPFNSSTKIVVSIPFLSRVELHLYNSLGQSTTTIFSGVLTPGFHTMDFSPTTLSSGWYLLAMTARPISGNNSESEYRIIRMVCLH
jgi:hypothetical protein